jgi:hypothetical protein
LKEVEMATHKGTHSAHVAEENPGAGIFQKGSTQVALMASVVTVVSQPFAQSKVQTLLGLPEMFPVIVAIVVSVLLAAYQVFAVQRAKPIEGMIMVPLVALIVFSSYAGTNQFFANGQTPAANPADKIAQERLQNLEAQLDLQKRLNDHLLKAAGLASSDNPQARSSHAPQTRNGIRDAIDKALGILIAPAYAQDDRPARMQEAERKRLEAQLRDARLKQLKLEDEQRRLQKLPHNGQPAKPPLLKSW